MQIKKATLYLVEQELLTPFSSGIGKVDSRESIILQLEDEDGFVGWGEVVAFSSPWYTEETVKSCWHIIQDFLLPLLINTKIKHPSDLVDIFSSIKRNLMAKAGVETAIWDLYAKRLNISLSNAIGGSKKKIESGVVVGIENRDKMLESIGKYVDEGYKRIKIKIKPGLDYQLIKEIRDIYPNIPLMADANSTYSLQDMTLLKALDKFNLMMIEQPLASDDIIDHAKLQKEITTPICLDESIVSYDDARKAIELGSCKVMNIKIGRVGGLTEAIKIHNLCKEHNIPVWCGGMLEMGISRAVNIALASLENFLIPGDISATSRYWKKDITIPEVFVEKGSISVPENPGIGFSVDFEFLNKITKNKVKLLG